MGGIVFLVIIACALFLAAQSFIEASFKLRTEQRRSPRVYRRWAACCLLVSFAIIAGIAWQSFR
jgi:hypothetical protein